MDNEKGKNTIKVLLVLPFFYPHRGGSQKYAEEIFAFMIKNHKNVAVDVLCYNTDKVKKFEKYRNFNIHRVGCINIIPSRFALPNPVSLISVLVKLSKNKYNFVNTHIRFFDPTWWLWIYAKIVGAKSIYTGHVAVHPVHQCKIVELAAKIVDLTIARASLSFYDYLTFTNRTAIEFFKTKLGVKKQTHLMYGGVDTKFFSPSKPKTNRVLPKTGTRIEDSKVLVTYVGRLIWTKGITYYLKAIKKILEGHKNVIFVLAGPGNLKDKIAKEIKRNNIQDKVILTGDLEYMQVKNLLSISDIFVNPSHHSEGFPNTVLEAGASGCYVIACDNAGTWEVVKNGSTGQLVEQKNVEDIVKALDWALKNPEKREKMAKNFRKELVDNFDWDIISEQLYSFLTSN